ncbi:MAG: hypothetical protein MUC41_09720 [Syntrophobacteraceae bacterium]|nr:hypothetical protein [Syntrophobacteraceae bacterium]
MHRQHGNRMHPCDDHHHGQEGDHHHHHPHTRGGGAELTDRQRLVIRLEHALHHNNEHAQFYEKLAGEAARTAGDAAAEEIRKVARYALRQNEHIEKALSLIQTR